MKSARMKLLGSMILALTFLFGEAAFAASKTLIEMKGDAPSASLAKSWKKVKDGEYEFELDTTQEVKSGVKVTPAIVKADLDKLSSDGIKVTEKGASAVTVTYTGDEKKMLEKLAKTKIRGSGAGAELAMDDSVSEGGIRAKPVDRAPKAGEVKGSILKIGKGVITGNVLLSNASGVKENATVKVKGEIKGAKKGELFYFVPDKDTKGTWSAKKDTLTQQ